MAISPRHSGSFQSWRAEWQALPCFHLHNCGVGAALTIYLESTVGYPWLRETFTPGLCILSQKDQKVPTVSKGK